MVYEKAVFSGLSFVTSQRMTAREDRWLSGLWLDDWQNTNEWQNEWINEWVNEWVSQGVSEWTNEWINEWIDGWMSKWTKNERTVRSLFVKNEWMNEWMGHYSRQSYFQTLQRNNKNTDWNKTKEVVGSRTRLYKPVFWRLLFYWARLTGIHQLVLCSFLRS